jgi:DNA-repair protein complementing XP-A cells
LQNRAVVIVPFCFLAKARQREKEASASASAVASSVRNANNKRPLSVVVPAASGSPTGPSKQNASAADKLQRDSRLGKYFDYDLSKMVNSKGGFLVEDDKEVDDEAKAKERERERERAVQNLEPRTCPYLFLLASAAFLTSVAVIAIYLDASRNPKCRDCGSVDIDHMYRNIFRCLVCNKCRNEKVEKYSLLTKTECKEVTVIHLTRII